MYLNFALGKAFEDLKQYDTAFKYLTEGNSIKRNTYDYSIEEDKLFLMKSSRFSTKNFSRQERTLELIVELRSLF